MLDLGKILSNPVDVVKTVLNPAGALIDLGASALGISGPVKEAAKLAAGIVTLNPVLIFDGATGLVGECTKGAPPAATEHVPPKGGPHGAGYAQPPPGRPCGPEHSASAVPGGSHLDPNIHGYRDCLETLLQNWEVFDTAVGVRDEYIRRENLIAICNNPAASSRLKAAAWFLLQHPEYFSRLEMAAGVGGRDGIIGKGDVVGDLARVKGEIAQYGVAPPPFQVAKPPAPPPGSTSGSGGASRGLSDILSDPTLSIEEKIELILQRVCERTDEELLATMRELDALSSKKADLKDPNDGESQKIQRSIEQLNLRIQKLVERRRAMFDLMSNMSQKFNEMARTAIQNMARA